jgi:hypothetical protein
VAERALTQISVLFSHQAYLCKWRAEKEGNRVLHRTSMHPLKGIWLCNAQPKGEGGKAVDYFPVNRTGKQKGSLCPAGIIT